jgi:signal transduction histidine kinase
MSTLERPHTGRVVPKSSLHLLPRVEAATTCSMMRAGGALFYYRVMVGGGAADHLRALARKRRERIPVGITWSVLFIVDAIVIVGGVIATVQRPASDLPVALLAFVIALSPPLIFIVTDMGFSPTALWAAWSATTAMMLFATSTPVHADFAPTLLVLMVGAVGALSSALGGLLATLSACALLLVAAAVHRLDSIALYLGCVGVGWLIGYLMRIQRSLLARQIQSQQALAEHAAADERRRIAREVHDVIAHSLSITLLHLTGARRGLQQDRDIDDAVDSLEQAERLGRQAMADIRRTVGLLDDHPTKTTQTAPEPGIHDIAVLVTDFERAGLAVTLRTDGPTDGVSAAVGLALYRIAQESLANIAKHAPDSKSTVVLTVSPASAHLAVSNQLPAAVTITPSAEGRGLRGMRQRVELLGGTIDAGPTGDGWSVGAEIPLDTTETGWPQTRCAP